MSEVEADEVGSGGKPLTPAEWAEVVALWELGEVTLEDLSKRFGITQAGLSKGLKKRGAKKGSRSKEITERVTKSVIRAKEDEIATSSEERQRKILETKSQHYDWAKMLGQQIVGRLAKAQQDGRPFETELQNIKTLRIAIAGLGQIRQERYAILDADKAVDEDELPQLIIQDLSEDEIRKLQAADDDLDGVSIELPAGVDEIIET